VHLQICVFLCIHVVVFACVAHITSREYDINLWVLTRGSWFPHQATPEIIPLFNRPDLNSTFNKCDTCLYVCMYVSMYVYLYAYVYVYVRIYMCMSVYLYVYSVFVVCINV